MFWGIQSENLVNNSKKWKVHEKNKAGQTLHYAGIIIPHRGDPGWGKPEEARTRQRNTTTTGLSFNISA